jgi:hypothetical protein
VSDFGVSGIIAALKAESLMEGSQLFGQIESLRTSIAYKSGEGVVGFDDYFKTLIDAIDAIPKLQLEDNVAPGAETTYTIQLTQEVERIVDECDRLFRRLNQFEGKLRDAERSVNNQKAEFVAWYMLAAGVILKDLESKLPQTKLADLAQAEFSRLIGGLDVILSSLLDAVKIETKRVEQHKSTQKEKYQLGKDQANASWTSSLPAFGNSFAEDQGNVSGVQEMDDTDVPEPVKAKPQISIGDTLRIIKPEDTQSVKVVDVVEIKRPEPDPNRHYNKFMEGEVPKSPRRKLVDEVEEL